MAWQRRKAPRETQVPTDSLSDVAFLLIIFFILTTSIQRIAGISSELPAGRRGGAEQTEKSYAISLHDGAVTFNDKAVSLDDLGRQLKVLRLDLKKGEQKVGLVESSGFVA